VPAMGIGSVRGGINFARDGEVASMPSVHCCFFLKTQLLAVPRPCPSLRAAVLILVGQIRGNSSLEGLETTETTGIPAHYCTSKKY
jgi:hypothetical protein